MDRALRIGWRDRQTDRQRKREREREREKERERGVHGQSSTDRLEGEREVSMDRALQIGWRE